MTTDAPNINRLWADLLVEELIRSGVDTFCMAPGSRSTPLVTAIAAHPKARRTMHFDERGVSFFALGYGRATGRAAAVVTTSGTALANLFPAVVEAANDGVPMLLLTADRPPELRDTGANQTIDQVKFFGGYVRWHVDLPAPDLAVPPSVVLTTIDQAVYRTRQAPAGPVHVNAMFREPLAPISSGEDFEGHTAGIASWFTGEAPHTHYAASRPALPEADIVALRERLLDVPDGLLVVGKLDGTAHVGAVRRLASFLSWPLLPDAGSQLRFGMPGVEGLVPNYDQILLSSSFAEAHRPGAVLHLGGAVTSKRLLQFLGAYRPSVYVSVHEKPSRLDPNHQVTHAVQSDVAAFCEAFTSSPRVADAADARWRRAWEAANAAVSERIDRFFGDDDALSEPLVARLLSREFPPGSGLVLASSMPIRDMDMYGRNDGPAVRVAANRGASGIDGTVATAAGFATGLGQPVTLLIGDLALLHDLNALAMLRDVPVPVVVVVLNNDGGGIFSFLPIARHEDVFEPYFGTPHGLTFEHAALQFRLPYHRPSGRKEFVEAYRAAMASGAPALIEVVTDRRENYALHRALQQHIAEGL